MNFGVVIPTFNESESIAALIQDIHKFAPGARIVVVDDSPDQRTSEAAAPALGPADRFIKRASKGGRGTAVIEGMTALLREGTDIIVEMDADFSHPPSQIPELVKTLSSDNLDLLIASRYMPGGVIRNWPLSRLVFSSMSNMLARFVLRVPVHDYTNGFRCYSRRAAELVTSSCGRLGAGFIVLSEILVNIHYRGYRVAEVPTVFVNRLRGESSLNAREILGAIRGLVRIYQLKNELTRGAS